MRLFMFYSDLGLRVNDNARSKSVKLRISKRKLCRRGSTVDCKSWDCWLW